LRELENENQNKESKSEEKKEVNLEDLKEEVIKVLRMCYDPEIPVNIYDLGLIYDIKIATNGDVLVIMTLTSPACPVAGSLPNEVQEKLREHPMIHDARVEITFDPPWGLDRMSEEAKLELGFL
jgi:FeS assembly SUF system protein